VSQTLQTTVDAYQNYLQNRAAHTLAFQRAVADSVGSGVASSNVYVSAVSGATIAPLPVPTRAPVMLSAPVLAAPSAPLATTATTGDALRVVYGVVAYSNALSNTQLKAVLTKAVKNGLFDDLLNLYAQTEGATGLIGAKSKEVEVRAPADGRGGSDDDSSRDKYSVQHFVDKLSTKGMLTGAGIGAALGVLALLLRYWRTRNKVDPNERKKKSSCTAVKADGDDNLCDTCDDIELAVCEAVCVDDDDDDCSAVKKC
jgi:hypothetical protein